MTASMTPPSVVSGTVEPCHEFPSLRCDLRSDGTAAFPPMPGPSHWPRASQPVRTAPASAGNHSLGGPQPPHDTPTCPNSAGSVIGDASMSEEANAVRTCGGFMRRLRVEPGVVAAGGCGAGPEPRIRLKRHRPAPHSSVAGSDSLPGEDRSGAQ
jgi:hypothetical protein